MEVQTFFLAAAIDHVKDAHYDVRQAAIVSLRAEAGTLFPVRQVMKALILLRRENADADAPATLRFNLVDEDGRDAGQPRRMLARWVFPAGGRFLFLNTEMALEFPRPGIYRLDITADEGSSGSVYHYNIQVLPYRAG